MSKPKIALTTDAVIFSSEEKKYQILLIKRKNKPFKGLWALPGGFLEEDEVLIDGCKRELEEETSLKVDSLQQVGVYDSVDRDPRGRMISVAFTASVKNSTAVKAKDDAEEAEWFPVKKLPKLAFDHLQIIKDAAKLLHITLS
ncbi:NUDIX hydrolase [Mesonia ostreae]|uniref:NUDIX hydrolase n=1 Tax=Mesonia ostreae TaxID=861110 RepID=A0ABU2KI08_9FLAO|nr:NUDIX hydrolase [Mesonia ostreae]MDT0294327.1 NUDIX hydrolase [Mesonia ostreae]